MKIEKGIPIPDGGRGRPKMYHFGEMEIGDSVFVEGQTSRGSAGGSARKYGHSNNKKFTCRTVDGGVRIWRVE